MNALASEPMGSETIRETHTSLEVVDAPLASLHPHPRNPRTITPARLAQLCRTLDAERDMLRARPIVALPDGTVIAGNQRLAAALELGWETIPTVFADLDDERAVRWMLLDNRGFGADDAGMVAELLAEIETAGADLLLTGYESGETDRLLRAYRLRDKDPDDAPPLPAGEPRSRRGEVYELGPHRLMCGDATSAEDVETLMDGVEPDLALTSPPYGVGKDYELGQDWDDLMRRWCPLATARAVVVNLADRKVTPDLRESHTYGALIDAMTKNGRPLIGTRIWVKPPAWGSPWWLSTYKAVDDWEFMGLFGDADYIERTKEDWRFRGVWEFSSVAANDDHPAKFPAELPRRWITLLTDEGGSVYDPFSGSGTTLIVAEQLGRRCMAMEIDPAYCDVIRDRYEAFVA